MTVAWINFDTGQSGIANLEGAYPYYSKTVYTGRGNVNQTGGTTTITGPLLASLLLGIADVAGKYYVPKLGAFIIYSVMIAILMVRPQGLFARAGGK